MVSKKRVPVTMRALLQRINRKYAAIAREEGLGWPGNEIKKSRGREASNIGDYYLLDTVRNFVKESDVDPADIGRELKVLAEWETVVD